MLVLSRRVGEEIVIEGDIRVVVVNIKGTRVRLGISAPPHVPVLRQELIQRDAEHHALATAMADAGVAVE